MCLHAIVLAFRHAGVSDIRDRGQRFLTDTDHGHGHELKKGVMQRHWVVGVLKRGLRFHFRAESWSEKGTCPEPCEVQGSHASYIVHSESRQNLQEVSNENQN